MLMCSGLIVLLGLASLRAEDDYYSDYNSYNDYNDDFPDEEWDNPDRAEITLTENISAGEVWTCPTLVCDTNAHKLN